MSNTNTQIGMTIYQQLGGVNRLAIMAGCKNFCAGEKGVQFKVGSNSKKVTHCTIELDPSDTYTVKFFNIRGTNIQVLKELNDIYDDMLINVFETNTGMYLSL